jgi:hypothetical protein
MTTADNMKTHLELKRELEDTREALTLALDALNEALDIGTPAVRDRSSLLGWSHLRVTAQALMAERDSKMRVAKHANDSNWGIK